MLSRRLSHSTSSNATLYVALLLCIFSLSALLVNSISTHYPGNNYFPNNTLSVEVLLLLWCIGCKLQYGEQSAITRCVYEIHYWYLCMALVVLATVAAQYTPFTPIDTWLLQWNGPHTISTALIEWTQQHAGIKSLLDWIYGSLTYELIIIPLLLIICRQSAVIREYYFLLLANVWLGFSIYYFFPTTAPASQWHDVIFSQAQYATGLKFYQIHHYLQPTTLEGGMVAFPSFHVIWAWLCVYVTRQWYWVFVPMLAYNSLLVMSCVLLGWHYLIDVFGSVVCLSVCHYGYYRLHLTPAPNDNRLAPIVAQQVSDC